MENRKPSNTGKNGVYMQDRLRNSGYLENAKSRVQATMHRAIGTKGWCSQRHAGFTLIELVVVLVALGTLSAFAATRLSGFSDSVERKAVASAVEVAAQKVLLSENLNVSDFENCPNWAAQGTDIGNALDADLRGSNYDGYNSAVTSAFEDYTQGLSLPGVGSKCIIRVRLTSGDGKVRDFSIDTKS